MSSPPALASSPPSVAAALRFPPIRHRSYLRPACATGSSRAVVARGDATARDRLHPRLVAAQSTPPTPLAAVTRDAETGLAILLVVLASVMTFSLSLVIFSFAAHKALNKLEVTAKKLAKIVAEEVPGTLTSLKLSFLEVNDLTRQLQNLRKRFTIRRSGKEHNTDASSWTGQT